MKKTTLVFVITLFVLSLCVFYYQPSTAQNKSSNEDSARKPPTPFSPPTDKLKNVPQMITDSKSAGAHFERRELFQPVTGGLEVRAQASGSGNQAQLSEVLNAGVVLSLNGAAVADTLQEKPESLTLGLPDGQGGTVELELTKSDIFAAGFSVKTSIPTTEDLESLGVHYRGVVKGNDRSVAAISVFKNEVMGFYSTEADGNSVVGRLGGNNPTNEHIVYDVKDLKVSHEFACDTKEPEATVPASGLQEPAQVPGVCVRMYLEATYDLFQNKGSVANAANYLTGLFNQSATLFSNDDITVSISEIFIWNSPSPYDTGNRFNVLSQFSQSRTSFNGDLAHLITLDRDFGGIAWIDALCTSTPHAVSDIEPTYDDVPAYSETVYLLMHETGHNLGSYHTHACVWNGNNTAIDSCGPSAGFGYEGSCSGAPLPPPNGGTIMSYCNFNVGINFALGFGPQPRNVILNEINSAPCVSCGGGETCMSTPITFGQPIDGTLIATDCRYPLESNRYSDTYTLFVPPSQQVIITMTSSDFDTLLVLQNQFGTELANDNDGGGGTNSRIPATTGFFTLVYGPGTYTIRATSNLDNASGSYTIGVTRVGPPNDHFVDAQEITGSSGTVTGTTNISATKEPGEPNHAGSTGGTSIWYSWQAPSSGKATISTVGSDPETLLGIYTGSSVSLLTSIASNDDDPTGGVTSRVIFNATAGTIYRIAVDTKIGWGGNITLNWSLAGPPTNFALATNGGVASASSTLDGGRAPGAAINGDRRGVHWGSDPATGSGWHDATAGSYPDWLQIDFGELKSINEIDVFSVQDNYGNPSEPTDTMTFGLYGLTAFEVQYWTGSIWVTVPGASVTGNNKVRRTFTFSPTLTSKIRVLVSNALAGYSRITEVEAWGSASASAPVNVALLSNSGVAQASSTLDGGRLPTAVNNGDRKGVHWGSDPGTGSGWHDATANSYPDWVQVDFAGTKSISEIDVFTVQDNYSNPSEPTDTMTFGLYGITGFEVQYWTGSSWITVPGGSVTGNNKVKRTFTFSPITTDKIRVLVNNALAGYSRITEVEAWESGSAPPPVNVALDSNSGGISVSSTLDAGRAAEAAYNGDRRGLHWGSDPSTGSGWHDATLDTYQDWLQINFIGWKTINEIDVFTVQDNFNNPSEPTDTMTFGLYGITDFEVQYFNGSDWLTVPGGSVFGNNNVKRTFRFSPITTPRIRVLVNNALAGYTRITEVEAYQAP